MKTIILAIALSLVSLQAYAGQTYKCTDPKTGAMAGKLIEGFRSTDGERNGRVTYFSSETSSEGWILIVDENGKIYNADNMVKHGWGFQVGIVQYESSKLIVTINSRRMICFN